MFSDEIVKTKKQLENAKTIFDELMLLRKKKLLGLVFVASETGISKSDFENMLDFEKEFFDKTMENMKEAAKKLSSQFINGSGRVENNENNLKLVLFLSDVEEFVDSGIVTLATANETQIAGTTFSATFNYLNQAFGGNALRRIQNGGPVGRVGLAAFECIAVGVAKNIINIQGKENPVEYVRQRIEEFWEKAEVQSFFTSGLRGTTRIQRTVPFGAEWFGV